MSREMMVMTTHPGDDDNINNNEDHIINTKNGFIINTKNSSSNTTGNRLIIHSHSYNDFNDSKW